MVVQKSPVGDEPRILVVMSKKDLTRVQLAGSLKYMLYKRRPRIQFERFVGEEPEGYPEKAELKPLQNIRIANLPDTPMMLWHRKLAIDTAYQPLRPITKYAHAGIIKEEARSDNT